MAPSFNSVVVPITEVPREDDIDDIQDRHAVRPFVLVVDDEPIVADTLAAILLRSGFDTASAYSANAALELTRGVQPAFLITDVHMPGMNGIELAMVLAEEFPQCKILLFSGHATLADLADARAAGYHFPLLTKPVHPAEIVKHVSNRLKHRQANTVRRFRPDAPDVRERVAATQNHSPDLRGTSVLALQAHG